MSQIKSKCAGAFLLSSSCAFGICPAKLFVRKKGGGLMRIIMNCVLGITTIALFSSPIEAQPRSTDLDKAQSLLKAGQPAEAIALVDPIIAKALVGEAKDPSAICPSVAAAFLQGFMKGNFVISIEDDWCDAMLVKAYALNELKRPNEALSVLKDLVGHAPENPNYFSEYAYTTRVAGNTERSLDLYKEAEKVASRISDRKVAQHWRAVALRGQGYAYSDLNRWNEAEKAYRQSFKYEPDNEIARNELRYIEEHRPK